MRGYFITFEGTEGSGKSTQIPLAADSLRSEGRQVLVLREPGGTSIGEQIRLILKDRANAHMTCEAELLLMNASRAQLVREKIVPAIENGWIVLCDRFADSTVAYQAFGRAVDRDTVERVTRFATCGLAPDITFLLTVSLEVSQARQASRELVDQGSRDRFDGAGRAFFERVERGYDHLASIQPDRIKKIDASGTLEQVRAKIWHELRAFLDQRAVSER